MKYRHRLHLGPVGPVGAGPALNNVPLIFRVQGPRQQTLRMLRPAPPTAPPPVNPRAPPPAYAVSQGLLRQALSSQPRPAQPLLVRMTPAPVQPSVQTSQPIILSVASLAPPNTQVSHTELFVCPGFPNKCRDGGFKTRSNMIHHWTMDHFYASIVRTINGLQKTLE